MKRSPLRTQIFACLFTLPYTTQIKSACTPLNTQTTNNVIQDHDVTNADQCDFVRISDEISLHRSHLVALTPLFLSLEIIQAFTRATRRFFGIPSED